MNDLVSALLVIPLGALAAIACVTAVVATSQFTSSRQHGYFHWVIPAILIINGLIVAMSDRSIAFNGGDLVLSGGVVKDPIAAWGQRIGTLLILAVSIERLVHHFSRPGSFLGRTPVLTGSFIAFWFCSILLPMFMSAHPGFNHDRFYSLLIGMTALLLPERDAEITMTTARNALFLFLLAGYALLPIHPNTVLDSDYTQGLLHGIPRFAGLAPHAVTEGMFAQLALLFVWIHPYADRRINTAAWTLGLITLFLAQSKTSWVSFIFCAAVLYVVQHGPALRAKLTDPGRPQLAITLLLGMMTMALIVSAQALMGHLGDRIDHFLNSDEGAQLTSLTGRDIIWSVAWHEWLRYPVFGYGPSFLNESYRLSIGLPNATHGHNQYMDLLPRSGLVGGLALTIYLVTLGGLSSRYAKVSRGLTLALFLAIALRAVSEVPLNLDGYGPEFINQLLLLVLLSVYSAKYRKVVEPNPATSGATTRLQEST